MKVLNFGSCNIDYVYQMEHFIRPGETAPCTALSAGCGGKGLNQSIAFARAGATVFHAGCIGEDGEKLRRMLADNHVDTTFVRMMKQTPCGHAIIQVTGEGENCILLFGGANLCVDRAFADSVLANFGEGDFLMLQNEISNLDHIIRVAHSKKMAVALNPSPFNSVITALDLSMIDWLILNETEGMGITGESDPDRITAELLNRYPAMRIVLTLGSKGAMYADRNNRERHGIFKAPVVDTTAAGDTFTGFFFASILNGNSPAASLRIASAASAIAVSRKGAAPSIPSAQEVADSDYLKPAQK